MKKLNKVLWFIALTAITVLSMTTCDDDNGGGPGGGGKGGKGSTDIYAVDTSKQTDWDYMIGSKSGEAVFFRANKSNGMPKEMYLKQDKNSDDGFTLLLNDAGLPEKVVHNGYTFVFNYSKGYKYDAAVIYPDGKAEYHFDIQTDIDFEAHNKKAVSAQGRSLGGDINDVIMPDNVLEAVGLATNIATCLVAPLAPPAVVPCVKFLAGTALEVLVVHYLNDLPEDIGKMVINAYQCVDGAMIDNLVDVAGIPDAAASCISLLSGAVDLLFGLDQATIDGKFKEIETAVNVLTKNVRDYDIVVTVHWTNGDLVLIVKDQFGEEGHYSGIASPNTVSWRKGEAPAGKYTVAVKPIGSWGKTLQIRVVIYAFGRSKSYTAEIKQGLLDPGVVYNVATFDRNGIYSSGN